MRPSHAHVPQMILTCPRDPGISDCTERRRHGGAGAAEAAAAAVRLAMLADDGPTDEFFSCVGTVAPWWRSLGGGELAG
jgi:hypothetical protein